MLRFFRRLPPFGVRQDGKMPSSRIGSFVPFRSRNHCSIIMGRKAQSAATLKGATAKDAAVDLHMRKLPPGVHFGRGRPVARPG